MRNTCLSFSTFFPRAAARAGRTGRVGGILCVLALAYAVETAALLTSAFAGEIPGSAQAGQPAPRPTLSLSPATIKVRCQPGQASTHKLRLNNQTPNELAFQMVAQDVLLSDGKRIFAPAGETPRSIAANTVFSPKLVTVKPGETVTVDVIATVPLETSGRAIVAIFRGTDKLSAGGTVMMTASLGTLITFTLSEDFQVDASPIKRGPQTGTTNVTFSQWLTNKGTEAVAPQGVAAVLDEAGTLVSKAAFQGQQLLPGERLEFMAECPSELKPGHYRVLASFQFEGKTLTSSGELTVR